MAETTFDKFRIEYGSSFKRFNEVLDNLRQKHTALGVFEIGSCNAADPDHGYCFSRAACSIRSTDTTVAFASLFLEPFKVLKNLFCDKTFPEEGPNYMRLGLEKLMIFMMNKG